MDVLSFIRKFKEDLPVDLAWEGIRTALGKAYDALSPKDIKALKVHFGAPPDLDDEQITDAAKGLLRQDHDNALRQFEARLKALNVKDGNRLRLILVENADESAKNLVAETRRREAVTAARILDYLYLDDTQFADRVQNLVGRPNGNTSRAAARQAKLAALKREWS